MKVLEVFWRFLLLGFVSFGGPVAHIGYFRTVFVEKLKWLDDKAYANLIALSQFLPGPGSSQVGFALGLNRAGLGGGLAAFLGFTLPSFLLLYVLAVFDISHSQNSILNGVIYGLKLFAVVVVTDAIYGMFKSFCKDSYSIAIAIVSACIILLFASLFIQIAVLSIFALVGILIKKNSTSDKGHNTVKPKYIYLILFFAILFGVPFISQTNQYLWLFSAFYEAGSLVFGGGHVVLPLLQQTIGDNISSDSFLLGYAAAQAVPGPMFSLASYLGADILGESRFFGALIATLAIFLPGFLLVLALKDSWESLAKKPSVAGAVYGINASVVGLLIAAFINPVFISAVHGWLDFGMTILGFFILKYFKVPIYYLIVVFCVFGSLAY